MRAEKVARSTWKVRLPSTGTTEKKSGISLTMAETSAMSLSLGSGVIRSSGSQMPQQSVLEPAALRTQLASLGCEGGLGSSPAGETVGRPLRYHAPTAKQAE